MGHHDKHQTFWIKGSIEEKISRLKAFIKIFNKS